MHKAQDFLINRIAGKAQDGPWPKVWFSAGLADEVWDELSSEKRKPVNKGGKMVNMWVNSGGRRNEALDCLVYSLTIHRALQPDIMDPEQWDKELERRAAEGAAKQMPSEQGYF